MDQEADGRPTVSNRFRPWTHLCLRPGPHVAAHGPQAAACLLGRLLVRGRLTSACVSESGPGEAVTDVSWTKTFNT